MKTFREALQTQDFVLTAELNLSRESDPAAVIDQARALSGHVHAVQVSDSPDARVHFTPSVAAGLLIQNKIEPIAQLTCRDRNRVALEGELLSLGAMGVDSVLLLKGDRLPDDHRPRVQQVFELGGKELIETARSLAVDPTITAVPDFHIGTVATVFSPRKGWKPRSLLAKTDAGANFIQTQLCFDMPALRRYMSHLVEAQLTWRTAIVVGIATLPTAMTARWLHENVQGSVIPKKVIRRLQQARDPEQEGVTICAELLEELQDVPGVSGAHLVTPGDQATIAAAISQAKVVC
jgi:methylenetetrahydrofolate reductase (NADPH)